MTKTLEFSSNKQSYFLAFLIFILNLSVSLYRIGSSSFWFDEIISVKDTLLDFGHIKHESEWDANPPFYYYLLWIWSKFFGVSEIGIRSFSAFFTSLCSMLIFLWLRNRTKTQYALVGALIFVFHPYMYYYSQEARCYGLLVFVVMLNLYSFQRFLEKPTLLRILTLGICNFLLVYTHYLAGFVLVPQFIYLLWVSGKDFFRKGIFVYIIPILLVIWRFTPKQFDYLMNSKKALTIQNSIQLANIHELLSVFRSLFLHEVAGIIIVVAFIGFFVRIVFKRNKEINLGIYVLGYVLFCSFTTIFILFFIGKVTLVFSARYLLFLLPLFIMGFSCVLYKLNFRFWWAIGFLIISMEIYNFSPGKSRKMDYRVCAMVLKKLQARKDMLILVQTKDMKPLMVYYYDRNLFLNSQQFPDNILKDKAILFFNDVNELAAIDFSQKKECLLIQTFENKKNNPKLNNFLLEQMRHEKVRYRTLGLEGLTLSLF